MDVIMTDDGESAGVTTPVSERQCVKLTACNSNGWDDIAWNLLIQFIKNGGWGKVMAKSYSKAAGRDARIQT